MSVKKQYLKSKEVCKVTFRMPKEAAPEASRLDICGEFTGWAPVKMNQLKDGSFKTLMELVPGNSYQYRFLVDGDQWINDWEADEYVSNKVGLDENSVIVV